jgi:hypothetical protein
MWLDAMPVLSLSLSLYIYICMYVCMYVCMYACMYEIVVQGIYIGHLLRCLQCILTRYTPSIILPHFPFLEQFQQVSLFYFHT